jgi:demethylmenaquinone methyltransferase/2-methoxy-6-polyprenyl-1,4-benzoquinol methylase
METPDPDDTNRFAQRLFAPLPRRYDRLAELLSMGQNGRWRRAMVDHILPDRPGLILDVASGPAGVAIQLADRSRGRVVGIDLTLDMLRQGLRNVNERGMADRIQLVAGRAEQMPVADDTFDALTFTYLLRYVDDPQATLSELARVVKPSSLCPAAGSGDSGGGGTPGSSSPPVAGLPGVGRGSRWVGSSAPTSRLTTAGIRSSGRSRHGSRPASSMSVCGA